MRLVVEVMTMNAETTGYTKTQVNANGKLVVRYSRYSITSSMIHTQLHAFQILILIKQL